MNIVSRKKLVSWIALVLFALTVAFSPMATADVFAGDCPSVQNPGC